MSYDHLEDPRAYGGGGSGWTEENCKSLKGKLSTLGYAIDFDPSSAPLVATLFRDVVKGARYGKTAQKLLDERNATIAALEAKLAEARKKKSSGGGGGLDPDGAFKLKCRFFRLLRLAGSAIYIASKSVEAPGKEPNKWSSASTGLLSALLSYEKQLALDKELAQVAPGAEVENGDATRSTFPSFLVEFHELWKTIEERDQARHDLNEKEKEFTRMLAGGTGQTDQSNWLNSMETGKEEELLLAVECFKKYVSDVLEDAQWQGENLGAVTRALSDLKTRGAELERANRSLESELRYVEKRFATHLKECTVGTKETTDSNSRSEPDRGGPGRNAAMFLEGEEQWREERKRLQIALDSKSMDISILQTQVAKLNTELHECSKNLNGAMNAHKAASEELCALQKRCDLFEKEFSDLDRRRVEDEELIKRLQMDLKELDSVNQKYEEAVRRLENVQIEYMALDQQMSSLREDMQCKAMEIEFLGKSKDGVEGENQQLQKDLEEARLVASQVSKNYRESRVEMHQMNLSLLGLQERLTNETKKLDVEMDRNRQLKDRVQRYEEGEVLLLRQRDEAAQTRELYRSSLKEARKRIESLQSEVDDLKARNDFILNRMFDNENGSVTGSPAIPATLKNSERRALNDSGSSSLPTEQELRNLKLENAMMRERYASTLALLEQTIEARKMAQAEVNKLTVVVTQLEASFQPELCSRDVSTTGKSEDFAGCHFTASNSLPGSRDPLAASLGVPSSMPSSRHFSSNGRGEHFTTAEGTDQQSSITSRFGSSNMFTVQSLSEDGRGAYTPNSASNTIQSASVFPHTLDEVEDDSLSDQSRCPPARRPVNSARQPHQLFRAKTQPVKTSPAESQVNFNYRRLLARPKSPLVNPPTGCTYDPTPVPTRQKDAGTSDCERLLKSSGTSNDETDPMHLSSGGRFRVRAVRMLKLQVEELSSLEKSLLAENANRAPSRRCATDDEPRETQYSVFIPEDYMFSSRSRPALTENVDADRPDDAESVANCRDDAASVASSSASSTSLASSRYSEYISRNADISSRMSPFDCRAEESTRFERGTPQKLGIDESQNSARSESDSAGPHGYCVDHEVGDEEETPRGRNVEYLRPRDCRRSGRSGVTSPPSSDDNLSTSFNLSKTAIGGKTNRTVGTFVSSPSKTSSRSMSSLWRISQGTSTAKQTSGGIPLEFSESSEATTGTRPKQHAGV